MAILYQYWTLNYINRLGRYQTQEYPDALEFIISHIPQHEEQSDQHLTEQLWLLYQTPATAKPAKLCLRCLISHQLKQICDQLVSQYGQQYNFTKEDLLPYLLDTLKPFPNSLTSQILQTFDPDKSSLFSWTKRVVKTNKEVKKFLLAHGIEQVTDWLLLKQTTTKKLKKILADFHRLTTQEVRDFQQLLTSFHTIYVEQVFQERNLINQQRKQQGNGHLTTPYPVPNQEQLQQMAQQLSATGGKTTEEILRNLQTLAGYIRQYKANRGRNVNTQSLGKSETKLAANPNNYDSDDQGILAVYQELLEQCLTAVTAEVVQTKVAYLSNKKKPKHQHFLDALHLFHCQHVPMKDIAPQVGLNTSTQVSRLLELKVFRADIARRTVIKLRNQVTELAQAYRTASEIKDLEAEITAVVEEQVNTIMEEAKKETTVSKNRQMCSHFSQTLCQYLNGRKGKDD